MSSAPPPVDFIEVTRKTYDALGYPTYRWVHSEAPPPFLRPHKPLAESRIVLIASGGIYVSGQIAFHFKDDISFHLIPTDVATERLRATHFAYDLSDARRDPNVVFPIDTLRRMAATGEIGGLTANAITFMGGIYSSRRVREKLAPAIARAVAEERADLALLVPV